VSQRKARVEHGLRDVLQDMIANDVRDPRVQAAKLVTVSRVELNVDLSVARVYVSVVGADATDDRSAPPAGRAAGRAQVPTGVDTAPPSGRAAGRAQVPTVENVIAGLAKAAGFLRGPVGRALGLSRPPELRFFHDDRIDISEKLGAIVREDEAKARAAGRMPGTVSDPVSDSDPASVSDSDPASVSASASASVSASVSDSVSVSDSASDSDSVSVSVSVSASAKVPS
jgi:ribosome-binding factor A